MKLTSTNRIVTFKITQVSNKETNWKGTKIFQIRRWISNVKIVAFMLIYFMFESHPVRCLFGEDLSGWYHEDLLDQVCWNDRLFVEVSGQHFSKSNNTTNGEIDYFPIPIVNHQHKDQNMYKWIPGLLLFQFFIVNIANVVWNTIEGGLMNPLIKDMENLFTEGLKDRTNDIADFMADRFRKRTTTSYAFSYICCEIATLIGTMIQLYEIDLMTDFTLSKEGLNIFSVMAIPLQYRSDQLAYLFPIIATCNVNIFGLTGDVEKHGGICVLTKNLINERYFVLNWIILIFFGIFDSLHLVYRMTTLLSWKFRYFILGFTARFIHHTKIRRIAQEISFGEWFLLYEIGINSKYNTYACLIDGIDNRLQLQNTEVKHTIIQHPTRSR